MMTRSCSIRRGVTASAHTTWWRWRFLGACAACCTILALEGCAAYRLLQDIQGFREYERNELRVEGAITEALWDYDRNAPKIRIGDSLDAVWPLLPRQWKYVERPSGFTSWAEVWGWHKHRILAKRPRFYLDNGVLVQIYYFRSSRIRDDRVTDDEFTPYIFRDGVLTSIGWRVLGGPNSFSSPPPSRLSCPPNMTV